MLDELMKIVENVVKLQNIESYEVSDIKSNDKGEGYLGVIHLLTLKDKINKNVIINLVIKIAFTKQEIRDAVPIHMAFHNEIQFYSKIHPILKEFSIKKCPQINYFHLFPQCYLVSSLSENPEFLVLENLKSIGYNTINKNSTLDIECTKKVLQVYGHFHAISMALKDQYPDKFIEIQDSLLDVQSDITNKESFLQTHAKIMETIINFFDSSNDSNIIEKLKNYQHNYKQMFLNSMQSNKYVAFLHGDCWSNNFLFKYQDGKLIDVKIIDLQLSRIASPVCDLSYFLYSGTTNDIFDNLNQLLDIYYQSFSKHLIQLGSDPEKVYPFNELKSQWKINSKYGMLMAFMLIKIKLTKNEDLIDLTDPDVISETESKFFETPHDNEEYKKRIVNLINHMHQLDAL